MVDISTVFIPSFWPCEREAFRVPDKLPLAEWANRNIVLKPDTSRLPGPYRWQRTPYVREVMNLYSRPGIRHIVLKWATQTGKTMAIYVILGYIVDQDPYSTMIVYPSDDECKFVSRTRIQPVLESCESIKAKIPSDRTEYQLQEMHFPGMILYVSSGSGATGLAQRPARNLLRDETNKYPVTIGEHGDPMKLSESRLKAFWDIRKIIDVSSPTTSEGNITLQEASCQVILRYFVPCPHCGRLQTLEFSRTEMDPDAHEGDNNIRLGQVRFENRHELPRQERIANAKRTAVYTCLYCGQDIEDRHKKWMLSRESGAGWFPHDAAEEPQPSDDPMEDLFREFADAGIQLESVAFRLSSLYSPWITWGDVVEEFLSAHLSDVDRFDKLRSFTNDWLGEEYRDVVAEKSESEVLKHVTTRPPLIVPAGAIALTAGIDNQKRAKYFCVWAWAKDFTAWLIHYGELLSWEDVTDLVFRNTYQVEDTGRHMRIWRAGLDTGGGDSVDDDSSMTQEAYEWLSRYGGNTAYGIKGSSRRLPEKMKAAIIGTYPGTKRPIPGAGVKLWNVDTHYFKDLFHDRLQRKMGSSGCIYLHAETGDDYAAQVVSEEKRRNKRTGRMQWEHVRNQNHYLDSSIYAHLLVDPMCMGGIRVLLRPEDAQSKQDSGQGQNRARDQQKKIATGKRRFW